MKIRHIVLISLIVTFSISLIILLVGLFVPSSALDTVSKWFGDGASISTTIGPGGSVTTITGGGLSPSGSATTSPGGSSTPTDTVSPTGGSQTQVPSPTATTTPTPVKCSGKTPCYGPSTMAAHVSASSCWSYQTASGVSVIYNMTSFNSVHSDGPKSEILAGCGGAINWASVPSNGKHTAAKSNTQSIFLQFKVGYYDASA